MANVEETNARLEAIKVQLEKVRVEVTEKIEAIQDDGDVPESTAELITAIESALNLVDAIVEDKEPAPEPE